MAAKAVHGDVSCCRDRMLVGCRCSGPFWCLAMARGTRPSRVPHFCSGRGAPRAIVCQFSGSRVGLEGRGRVPGVSGHP
eukprot:6372419-Prymnesium_polylepis.1